MITTVPISLFDAIATAGAEREWAEITSPFLPNSRSTDEAFLGFQVGTPLITPDETNVAQVFLLTVARADDLDWYLTFQTGLFRAENLVIAASCLFEYKTRPACNRPESIEFQLLVVFFKVARATCCSEPELDIFKVIASNLLIGLTFNSSSPLAPTAGRPPSAFNIASLIWVFLDPILIIGENAPVLVVDR